jgi:hypothetical protein
MQEVRLAVTPLGIKIPSLPAAYHSSVSIGEMEFTFSSKGIVMAPNFQSHRHKPAEVFTLGTTYLSSGELVKALRPFFKKGSYDLLRKNCNSFSDCALFYLLDKRLDERYRQMEQIGNTADQSFGIVQVFSLGDYIPNPKADGFKLEQAIGRLRVDKQNAEKENIAQLFSLGEAVEVFSHTNNGWVKASVLKLHNDGMVTVRYDQQELLKDVPAQDCAKTIRPCRS